MSSANNQSDPVAEFHRIRTELLFAHAGNVETATDELIRDRREIHEQYLRCVNTGAKAVYAARTQN